MTHIEDSGLQAKVDQFIDDIAVLRPYTRVTKEAKLRLMALIKSAREAWWVTTGLAQGGKKLLGPFATKDLALSVRSYMEIVEAPATYWVEEERKQ